MTITTIEGRDHDLGNGLMVRRSLPARACRSIGPFVFLDHAGPVTLHGAAARGADVRPHPHIGLSTVSYLLGGAMRHRDNLGSDQVIVPGDVNLMTSGRGIVHSERFDAPGAFAGGGLELIQFWTALPETEEERAPAFSHHAAADLPALTEGGVWLRVLMGSAYGLRSAVPTFSPTFYVHAELAAGARIELPGDQPERGAYVVRGQVRGESAGGPLHGPRQLLVFEGRASAVLVAETAATVMLFGGEPIGPRFLWWNFVSTSRERIIAAAADWKAGRMPLPASDDAEFVPLPDRPFPTERAAER